MQKQTRMETRLEKVSVDRPCPKRWAELVGDEKRRYCSTCSLHVTNLSTMERGEAEDFLARSEGRVCVAFVPDANGHATSVTAEVRVFRGRRMVASLCKAASFVLGLLFWLPGCRPTPVHTVGSVAPVVPGVESTPIAPIMGRVRADPVCQIEDERMLMGEMVVPVEVGGEE